MLDAHEYCTALFLSLSLSYFSFNLFNLKVHFNEI